jgi:hypothetical protein
MICSMVKLNNCTSRNVVNQNPQKEHSDLFCGGDKGDQKH